MPEYTHDMLPQRSFLFGTRETYITPTCFLVVASQSFSLFNVEWNIYIIVWKAHVLLFTICTNTIFSYRRITKVDLILILCPFNTSQYQEPLLFLWIYVWFPASIKILLMYRMIKYHLCFMLQYFVFALKIFINSDILIKIY